MSDAVPLPPRPHVEQYRKLAKELQHACKSSDPGAVHEWAARWAQKLAQVQSFAINVEAEKIEQHWGKFKIANESARPCTLARARHFIAREHGFVSWPKFAGHLEALANIKSPISEFEMAADAIVNGNSAALAKLLIDVPELARARSTRQHRSTLLHYVSANGVENFRQKTPENIIEITMLLLNAGADVDAESDAYGGRSTTLGLTATSVHPEKAGAQLALLELLIGHGARIDGPDGGSSVNACLRNGRAQAAEFLAGLGARLDLEGAAGTGRLDVVKSFFTGDSLKPTATSEQMKDGFAWACEFGRTQVVEFLLDRGMEVSVRLRHHGQTGLHWAAFSGAVDTVKILLKRHAPVDVKDETFGTTPLGWALYAWRNEPEAGAPGRHHQVTALLQVAALLIAAGARVEPDWLVDRKVLADPEMLAALTHRIAAG
ncbi:MAG: ankyrin repeat domain-containing protein [Acidobacteriota bacterium]|nr:ankyrin repeat domain-containing protein [Acidobacteriota bacterium]